MIFRISTEIDMIYYGFVKKKQIIRSLTMIAKNLAMLSN